MKIGKLHLRVTSIVMLAMLSSMLLIGMGYEYGRQKGLERSYNIKFNEEFNVFKLNDTTYASGYYRSEGYFCIVTKDQSAKSIAEVTFHELAHYYNYEETKHFKEDFKK